MKAKTKPKAKKASAKKASAQEVCETWAKMLHADLSLTRALLVEIRDALLHPPTSAPPTSTAEDRPSASGSTEGP